MKKLGIALVVSIVPLGALQATAEEVTLRGVSAFATGTTFQKPFAEFIDYVNDHGAGVVQIDYIGGPEAVPTFEVGNAVSSGVVDVANNTQAFYTNIVPISDALRLATNSIQEQRQNGCYDLIDQIHRDQMNVVYLLRHSGNMPFHLYTTKPIDGPDLSGMTIRTTPVYRDFFKAMGATLVQTAPGEVYTALERGAIDGYGWPIQGVLDLGWDEQTKYRVDPGFYQVEGNVTVNLDVWNGLSDEAKTVLRDAAEHVEAMSEQNVEKNAEAARGQAEAGIETITLEGEAADTYLRMAAEEGWAAVEVIDGDLASDLRACLTD